MSKHSASRFHWCKRSIVGTRMATLPPSRSTSAAAAMATRVFPAPVTASTTPSPLALDALMTNPAAVDAGDGQTPADLLRSGDPEAEEYVLGVVRAALSGGA